MFPTRKPLPSGLTTSVVPIVMFSFTSFMFGIVVFSVRKIDKYALSENPMNRISKQKLPAFSHISGLNNYVHTRTFEIVFLLAFLKTKIIARVLYVGFNGEKHSFAAFLSLPASQTHHVKTM